MKTEGGGLASSDSFLLISIPMITFPNAKINIGLNINSKREDGYHNLSSCFLPIPWKDALEVIPADQFQFTSSGRQIPEDGESNLCVKAYELIKERYDIPTVSMHLHKVIPMGAGLGGGSSDGAFTLKLLNEMFELNITNNMLEDLAKMLGADCPFFIDNRPKLVSGIGDIMQPVDLDLSGYFVGIVFPSIHFSTKTAFAGIKPQMPNYNLRFVLDQPPRDWQDIVVNDFEPHVFAAHTEIRAIKEQLLALGADYASMTGTGSAVYGIFDKRTDQEIIRESFSNLEFAMYDFE